MTLKFRDKIIALMPQPQGETEGYVYHVVSPQEVYVILAGQNNRPVMIDSSRIRLLDAPIAKRKRGRPRKDKK